MPKSCSELDRNIRLNHTHVLRLLHFRLLRAIKAVVTISLTKQKLAFFRAFQENLERYTHIQAESVDTKYGSVHVLFVSTRSGSLMKLSHSPDTKSTCLVELLQPLENGAKRINNMKLLDSTNSVYLATEDSVLRVPTQRCQRFKTESQCLNSMDPHCGWNKQKKLCTMTPNKNPRAAYWKQQPISCPVLTDAVSAKIRIFDRMQIESEAAHIPQSLNGNLRGLFCPRSVAQSRSKFPLKPVCNFQIDGGWSSFSGWFQCDYEMSGQKKTDENDASYCSCRRRNCDSPSPSNGGSDCVGLDLEVTNCTMNGGWTEWSDWSGCSKTCDVGMKQRRRTCGNPTPAFGGKKCIGQDVDSEYCDDLPPCGASSASLIRTVSEGRWTQWAAWSECSVSCGSGFRTRTRKCFGDCSNVSGCDREYDECNGRLETCPAFSADSVVKVTDWTPWVRSNTSIGGAWYEKRFRFSYRGFGSQESGYKEEERFCTGINHCSMTTPRDRFTDSWSEWSKCSRECGTGYQLRIRRSGLGTEEKACNTKPCRGSWGCWGEWSEGCDHKGKRKRTRQCEPAKEFPSTSKATCWGGSNYEETDCDGWGSWGEWGYCENGVQTRYRDCLASQCRGDNKEQRPCPGISSSGVDGAIDQAVGSAQHAASGAIVGGVICGFILGILAGAGLVYFFFVYRRPANGNPHYVSAKSQNLYVSLPMLDLKHSKHFGSSNQSDCGTLRSTTTAGSTLRSNKAASGSVYGIRAAVNGGSDYETATIKRSHSHRNSSILGNGNGTLNLRADVDTDSLFT